MSGLQDCVLQFVVLSAGKLVLDNVQMIVLTGLPQKCEPQVSRRWEDVPVSRQHEDWRYHWFQRAKWTAGLQGDRYCDTEVGEQKGAIGYFQRYFLKLDNRREYFFLSGKEEKTPYLDLTMSLSELIWWERVLCVRSNWWVSHSWDYKSEKKCYCMIWLRSLKWK